ncbi:Uncharacterised protein [Mycobacteroides abscessus subsp. abscessus]|nr:Uncharacterised protein [Mycobacteroides abscessus subsp. abscessus]
MPGQYLESAVLGREHPHQRRQVRCRAQVQPAVALAAGQPGQVHDRGVGVPVLDLEIPGLLFGPNTQVQPQKPRQLGRAVLGLLRSLDHVPLRRANSVARIGLAPRRFGEWVIALDELAVFVFGLLGGEHHPVGAWPLEHPAGQLLDQGALLVVRRVPAPGIGGRDVDDERLLTRARAGLQRLDQHHVFVQVQLVDDRAVNVSAVLRITGVGDRLEVRARRRMGDLRLQRP